jgi:hypothetical protein
LTGLLRYKNFYFRLDERDFLKGGVFLNVLLDHQPGGDCGERGIGFENCHYDLARKHRMYGGL